LDYEDDKDASLIRSCKLIAIRVSLSSFYAVQGPDVLKVDNWLRNVAFPLVRSGRQEVKLAVASIIRAIRLVAGTVSACIMGWIWSSSS